MKGLPFGTQGRPPAVEVFALGSEEKDTFFWSKRTQSSYKEGGEPRSVLERQRSPSPPTSTSTPSSSNTVGVAAVSENPCFNWPSASASASTPCSYAFGEWSAEPIPVAVRSGESWETMLSETSSDPPSEPSSVHSLLRWFTAEAEDGARFGGGGFADVGFGNESMVGPSGAPLPLAIVPPPNFSASLGFANNSYKAPNFVNSGFLNSQNQQVPHHSSFLPLNSQQTMATMPQPGIHHSQTNFLTCPEMFLDLNAMTFHLQPQVPSDTIPLQQAVVEQHQAVVDQLFRVAELLEAGNAISAHLILARLNHLLPSPSGKPLFRSAFYFKEALLAITGGSIRPNWFSVGTPLDVLLKLDAYKAFSEASPSLQFTSFTSTQAILEELAGANSIHVIDFDVGVGGHWSTLLQELSQRRSAAIGAPELRISAFVSMAWHHPLELQLIQENLTQFASNLGVPFALEFLPLESFDPTAVVFSSTPCEAIAVNFTVGSGNHILSTQTFLRLIKQLSPKIVIAVNHGCEKNDLPFAQHFLHSFQSNTILLESIEAAGVTPEVAEKIEKYLLQPRIESSMLGRFRAGVQEQLLPLKMLFTSAGFVPVQFSNFAETQAEFLLKKVQVRGFQVQKRQAALTLCWKQGEVSSISAWR
ncbi:hypothetical protein HPP92_012815 [Vanilla planifolia]|uniref:Scarecrow-like protein 6 n=1 Tax=Vanilla planifolia TaxID=51239 RepID=A0A835UU88_VANPL|nr:hypothetical protein HPP92_012815 [Vanilla planifolia]